MSSEKQPLLHGKGGANKHDDSAQNGSKSYSDERDAEAQNEAITAFDDEIMPGAEDLRKAAEKAERQKIPGCCGATRSRKIGLRTFYRNQVELLEFYSTDSKLVEEGKEGAAAVAKQDADFAKSRRMDEILAKITFGLNLVLLIAKIVAAVLSNSLSVVSTVIDSLVDLTSGLVIWIALRAIEKHNPLEYPRGRNKLEPLAVVIVAIIMGAANMVMIIQSVQSMIAGTVNPDVDTATLILLLTGTAIKVVLLIVCLRQKSPGSMVLAMDQRNDIITNLVAIGMGLVGTYLWLWADPIGAILVCAYIAGSWFYTGWDQIPILTGRVADKDITSRIIYIVTNHDDRIRKLDALWVYHYGTNFLVELHIVMTPKMTLQESHDIAEPLQAKLEKLPYVEKAFIHCDYKVDNVDHK